VVNADYHHRDISSSSSNNDEDGAMHHKKKREGIYLLSLLHPFYRCLDTIVRHVCFFDACYIYLKFYNSINVYLGIENLQGFCKQNQKFSTSVNPSEIFVNRESVRIFFSCDLFNIEFFFVNLRFDFCNVFMKEVYIKWKKFII